VIDMVKTPNWDTVARNAIRDTLARRMEEMVPALHKSYEDMMMYGIGLRTFRIGNMGTTRKNKQAVLSPVKFKSSWA